MDIFSNMLEIFDKNNEFVFTKNSYFEKHICGTEEIKVQMDYSIEDEKTGDTIVFGKCSKCNKVFYNIH